MSAYINTRVSAYRNAHANKPLACCAFDINMACLRQQDHNKPLRRHITKGPGPLATDPWVIGSYETLTREMPPQDKCPNDLCQGQRTIIVFGLS